MNVGASKEALRTATASGAASACAAGAGDSLATESTGTILVPRQMSPIAGHVIVEALEVMGYKWHIDKYGETYLDWEPKVRSEAQQIVTSITSFSFIVTFIAVYQYLSHLSGTTVKLQKTSLDIIKAHELVNEVNAA